MIKYFYNQRGFGLLENLIALTIVIISCVGIMIMQNLALSSTNNGYYSLMAVGLAQSWLERIRASNNSAGLKKESGLAIGVIQNLLPKGSGSYQCNSESKACEVTVTWQEQMQHQVIINSLINFNSDHYE